MVSMDILRTFAKNTRKYRLERGYSQEKLAECSGLHRTYISAVERCQRNIALGNVQRIAEALRIEAYLLFIENPDDGEQL